MRIGISLASYLPLAAWFPCKAVKAADEAGYEFIQVLPLRGLWAKGEGNPSNASYVKRDILDQLPVEYVENTWNTASSLGQVL